MKRLFTFERVLAAITILLCGVLIVYITVSNGTVRPIEIVYQSTTVLSMDELTAAATDTVTKPFAEGTSASAVLLPTDDEKVTAASTAKKTKATKAVTTKRTGKINVNTASIELLCELDGIGEVIAGRIVAYRESVGSYTKPEDLLNVSGIGEKRLAAIQDSICFN